MLIGVFDQFQDNPPALIAYLAAFMVALVIGLAFHEFSHAWSANELGDPTARLAGRLTLNPLKHLDPMGTILMLVVGFGFAKPTPVNPNRLKNGPVIGRAMVAGAGPLSNFFIAALAALPLKAGWIDTVANFDDISEASGIEILGLFLVFVVFFNVLLGVFNLIPIPPLDGFDVLLGVVPAPLRRTLDQVRPWGIGILMTLFIVSFATNGRFNPLGDIIGFISDKIFPIIT
ncbi:MAG: site-2 protease family protein [Dehalococcoidia bacterium]